MSIAHSLLAEFEAQAPVTRRFLERLPEEKLTWKPHEKSMTAGQLASILRPFRAGLFVLCKTIQPRLRSFQFSATGEPAGSARIFEESIATVRELLPKFDDAAMNETWRLRRRRTGRFSPSRKGAVFA